jgi:hypothetical protein
MGSDEWIPAMKDICFDFLKNIQKRPGGKFLRFRDDIGTAEKPGNIVKEYHKTAQSLKDEIFGKDADESHIDHHKIASLYIRSFLKYKPFYPDPPKETKDIESCMVTECPNEYFSIIFLAAIFHAWNDNYDNLMDLSYRDSLVKLLYHYKKDIKRLDPLTFSNIIFLIEQFYFNRSI